MYFVSFVCFQAKNSMMQFEQQFLRAFSSPKICRTVEQDVFKTKTSKKPAIQTKISKKMLVCGQNT
jgi:hypothetical protein